jgi:LEA14-like dessication related protein
MFRSHVIPRCTAISVIGLLAACAAPTTLVESPSVTLVGIQSGHMSFDRQTFVLGFDISNPNAFPLPVKAIQYRVRIAEQQFASGETLGGFTVPAGGDSHFSISVDLDMLQQTSRLATLLRVGSRGTVNYDLDGSLTANIPFTKPIRFSNAGTLLLASGL